MPNANNRNIVTLIVIVVVAVILYGVLTMPDQRTTGERVGDAIDAMPDAGKAVEQLEKRTPGEKLGDAIKDGTNKD